VLGRSNETHATLTREQILTQREAVTIQQAADHLGVSHKTIRRMIADGRLPAFRVGGGPIRVLASDVQAVKVPVRAS
jgi:excisionase family DNA binding protein